MNCSKAHKLVSSYIDGELRDRDLEAFEFHLSSCPACGREVEEVRELLSLFAHAEAPKAPYGFRTRVMARAASEKTKGFSLTPLFVRFSEAVVLMAIVFAGMVSGGFLAGGLLPERLSSMTSSLSLDLFDPAPPDSLGGAYLAMTEADGEE